MRPTLAKMAGGNAVNLDPALVRYANMYVKRHEFFRWTKRTAGLSFAYVIAVPSLFLYMAYQTEAVAWSRELFHSLWEEDPAPDKPLQTITDAQTQGKWNLRGKLRGDTIAEF
ncbi:hypothetical protein Q7P37_010398 [Cladosporium fusiforme]